MKFFVNAKDEINNKLKELFKESEIEIVENEEEADYIISRNVRDDEDITIVGENEYGRKNDIRLDEICYFETVGRDVYLTTTDDSYKIKERLYEVEELTENLKFIRVSKSHIVNVKMIKNVKSDFNSRYKLIMENDEKVFVTRTYIKEFRESLNL